eukprot:SAG31_NODE_412_length_15972_cov_3.590626_7_plen_63_part_00
MNKSNVALFLMRTSYLDTTLPRQAVIHLAAAGSSAVLVRVGLLLLVNLNSHHLLPLSPKLLQ